MEQVCKAAKHRVAKVLRIDLSYTEVLLEENPNLKVLHLFRDPRSIISSHFATSWYPLKASRNVTGKIESDIKVLCKRMRYDIDAGLYLLNKFPDRVNILQYEDLIQDSTEKGGKLFKFLGMNNSKNYQRFIVETMNIKSDKYTKGEIGEFSYRQKLSWNIVKKIDTVCKDVLISLGYKTYPSREDLNSSAFYPIHEPLPFALS